MKLKKPKKTVVTIAWRPDFRDIEDLPDIKVIRSGFFLSAFFVSMAVALLLFVFFREYQKSTTEKNVVELQEEVDAYREEHDRVVKLNKEFMELMKSIEEIDAHRSGQVVLSDLILDISSSLVEGMALSQISYGEDEVVLSGVIDVPAEEASVAVDSFMNTLREEKVDQEFYPIYSLDNLERKDGGGMSFKITMAGKPDPAAARKK